MNLAAACTGSVVAATLSGLALLHLYWAAGGAWGAVDAVPHRDGKPLFEPGPGACVVVALLLALAAALVESKATAWSPSFVPRYVPTVGTLGVGLAFTARAVGDLRWVGFFKRERGSRFAALDSKLYSPLCLLLGAGALVVAAIGSRSG